jgi:integrase
MGSIYKRGAVFWIKYYRDGIPMRESTKSTKETVAKKHLRKVEGDIENGIPVTPRANRVTLGELLDDVLTDYRVNGKRSATNVERMINKHLRKTLAPRRATSITTADLRAYIDARQTAKAKNATINREMSAIKRAFTLGREAGKITHKPKIPMLSENNVRIGFFEPVQYRAVLAHLSVDLQPVVTFSYLTGWRTQSEVLPLQWRQVDFTAGTVRLDPGTTKNGEARTFPFTADLRALLEAQRAHTDAVQHQHGSIIPWVFHRRGKRIRKFDKSWKTACKQAGCPGLLRHDFRRTAVRALVRNGIAERVAMTLTGHKTREVFERYNIVSEGDLADAARRIDAAGTITGTVSTDSTAAAVGVARK